jgi:hypothetical protein
MKRKEAVEMRFRRTVAGYRMADHNVMKISEKKREAQITIKYKYYMKINDYNIWK